MDNSVNREEIRESAYVLISKEYYVDRAIKKRSNSIVFLVCAIISTITLNGELEVFSEFVELYCFYKWIISLMESMVESKKATGDKFILLYTLIKIKEKILKYKEFFQNEELFKKYFDEISSDNLLLLDFDGEIENVKNINYLSLRKLTKRIKNELR